MTEFSDARHLAVWLKDKPPEFACALAARIALRVLPMLRESLCADEAVRRARIVRPCFRALAAASLAAAWPYRFGDIRQTARSAARAARDAMSKTFNDAQMNVIESIEAVPEDYPFIHQARTDANALGVVSTAVDTVTYAAQTAADLVDINDGIASPNAVLESANSTAASAEQAVEGVTGHAEIDAALDADSDEKAKIPPHISRFWKTVELDASHLEASSVREGETKTAVEALLSSPLWPDGIPIWASRRWADFKDDLPSGEGWQCGLTGTKGV